MPKFTLIRAIWALVFSGIGVLFLFALPEYRGSSGVFIIFTLTSTVLLYFGFRKNAIFFDTFIGVFFWLGFWLKTAVRVAFTDSRFYEHGGSFDGSGEAFDLTLTITSCAFLALIFASYVREKLIFVYPDGLGTSPAQGLAEFYRRNRVLVLAGFVLLVLAVTVSNAYLGIYQRGSNTETQLPFGLNGVYKWLILFGLASGTALILKFEYESAGKTTYLVAIIGLFETFCSNVSLLSRGMVLNTSALVYGVMRSLSFYRIRSGLRFLVVCFLLFVVLFASSVLAVNYLRAHYYADREYADKPQEETVIMDKTRYHTAMLFIDRWVGIEGVMAVSSYPALGWELWNEAWREKYSEDELSLYDSRFIDSPYKNTDFDKHNFVSLPGLIAFCFYPGSYVFLVFCLFILGIFAALIELFAYRLGGKNLILCALLSQVVAFRYASFGYVPAQSYLLFGSIFLNILLIYLANGILVKWYGWKGSAGQ